MSESNKRFDFDVTLVKAYKATDGTLHVIGVASDDDVDLTGDKMHTMAIDSMAAQAKNHKLPLLPSHGDTFGFGHTHDAWVKKGAGIREFVVDFALDARYPQAQDLHAEVASGTCKKQLSIGGNVNRADEDAVSYEEDPKTKRYCRVIKKITLDHIATTRPKRAAVPRTRFLEAIVKSVFEGEPEATMPPPKADTSTKTAVTPAGIEKINDGSAVPDVVADVPPTPVKPGVEVMSKQEDRVGQPAQVAGGKEQEATITVTKTAQAAEGLKLLERLGGIFASPATGEPLPEHVVALDKAINGLLAGGITEKSTPDVKRMVGALHKFLSGAGVKILDEEAEERRRAASDTTFKGLDEKAITDIVSKSLGAKETEIAKGLQTALGAFAGEIEKGLVKMGEGLNGKLEAITKSQTATDDRIKKLETVSGVRQSIPGQETVSKGVTNPATGTSAAPADGSNPFKGMFAGAVRDATAQFRGNKPRG